MIVTFATTVSSMSRIAPHRGHSSLRSAQSHLGWPRPSSRLQRSVNGQASQACFRGGPTTHRPSRLVVKLGPVPAQEGVVAVGTLHYARRAAMRCNARRRRAGTVRAPANGLEQPARLRIHVTRLCDRNCSATRPRTGMGGRKARDRIVIAAGPVQCVPVVAVVSTGSCATTPAR